MTSIIYFLCIGLLSPVFVHGRYKFADCGGEEKIIVIKDASIKPDPVKYPGNLSMTVDFDILKDLPASNLEMKADIFKLDPRRVAVPCLDNIGSCTYDVCEMIETYKKELCPMFPDPEECGCPMKTGSYLVDDAPVPLPDFGDVFKQMIKGQYEATLTFTDTDSDTELGCIKILVEIKT